MAGEERRGVLGSLLLSIKRISSVGYSPGSGEEEEEEEKKCSESILYPRDLLDSLTRVGAFRAESESLSTEGEEQPEDLSEPEATEGA